MAGAGRPEQDRVDAVGLRLGIAATRWHSRVTDALTILRCSLGMTQKQVAGQMGCTQSRVSKLEAGNDDDLQLSEVRDYARALGRGLTIRIVPGAEAIEVEWDGTDGPT